MRILVCNKFYRPVGGPETIILEVERMLTRDGHDVATFAMDHPENMPSAYSKYFVPNVDYNKGMGMLDRVKEAGRIIYSFEAGRRIASLVREFKPDIAHAHNTYHQLSPCVLSALRKAGIPTVLTLHDGKLLCANMLFLRDGLVALGLRASVIRAGVDIEKFRPAEKAGLRRKYRIEATAVVALHVGPINEGRNLHIPGTWRPFLISKC